jgi:CRISPR-associated exonuclease Cas4
LDLIPVTDLKQWTYCERIVYYHRVLPAIGKPTFKMREALAAQDLIEGLEMRRKLNTYGLEGARRRFGVRLKDEPLGLSGRADLVLEARDQVAVVDFKLTSGEVGDNHRAQLAGYSLLAEAACGLPAQVAFLYRIPDNRVFPVEITTGLRERVLASIAAMRVMAEAQVCPAATAVRARCRECEFANYCGDIW